MAIYEKIKDFVSKRKLEYMEAELTKQKAMSDYLTMMSGVEVSEQEVDENVV